MRLKFAFFVEQPLFGAFDIHGYLSIRLDSAVTSVLLIDQNPHYQNTITATVGLVNSC
jgi:hypothetical protein